MQRRLHWKGGMLCDRVLCDCVMGGKKWMRLHFSSFLHCCSKPCSSSCRCTWLPSNIYGCFLWNIVTFHLTSGWCHLNDFLLPVWSSTPWTCTYALTFSTMCPGQAEVVSPRLAQGLRPLSAFYFVHRPCAPHLSTCVLVHQCYTCIICWRREVCPGLESAIYVLFCPRTIVPFVRTIVCKCVSCPRKCAQLCQLSASRMCLLWTWQVLQQKQKCGCFRWWLFYMFE